MYVFLGGFLGVFLGGGLGGGGCFYILFGVFLGEDVLFSADIVFSTR